MNLHVSKAHIGRLAEQIAPHCDGDQKLLQDCLEGESDLISVASRIHEQIARDTEMLVGIKERKDALAGREKRIKDRVARFKASIGELLRAAKLTKLELPEVTYSVRDGNPKLDVADASAVPTQFLRYPDPTPDKFKINVQFGGAKDLPNWLTRQPPVDIVTGRVK